MIPTHFESIDFKRPCKTTVRLFLPQMETTASDWVERDGLNFPSNDSPLENDIKRALAIADEASVDLIIFPELAVPERCIDLLIEWTATSGRIAIAGTHYHQLNHAYVARCPVIIGNDVYFTEKLNPAPIEKSPISGHGLVPGQRSLVFRNTSIGAFAILICSDYLDAGLRTHLLEEGLDFLFVTAFHRDSVMYHSRMNNDCMDSASGVYIAYANMKCGTSADGRSSFFGVMDKIWFKKLVTSGVTDGQPQYKAVEVCERGDYAILTVDLAHKRPTVPRTVSSAPNIDVTVFHKGDFRIPRTCIQCPPNQLLRLQQVEFRTDTAVRNSDTLTPVLLPPSTPQTSQGLEIRSRNEGMFVGSLWDNSNPYGGTNARIRDAIVEAGSTSVWQQSRLQLNHVVEQLLIDLDHYSRTRTKTYRFICTNTTVENLGLQSWSEEEALRKLVMGTRRVLLNRPTRFECWRVFILRDPAKLAASPGLPLFYATIEENRSIGTRVAVYSCARLPDGYLYRYADFYCVPERVAFVSVVPEYYLSVFVSDKRDDRPLLHWYSELAEALLLSAKDERAGVGFEWRGGILNDLQASLMSLK